MNVDWNQLVRDLKEAISSEGAGAVALGEAAAPLKDSLVGLLKDSEPIVRLRAARALAGMQETGAAIPVIREFLEMGPEMLTLQAALAIDECDLLDADPSLAGPLKRAKGQYVVRVAKEVLKTN